MKVIEEIKKLQKQVDEQTNMIAHLLWESTPGRQGIERARNFRTSMKELKENEN